MASSSAPHVESGFLARFPQRDGEGIGVSVAVTAGLQPAPELAVVRKEHPVARHVHDPRRARDVAHPAGTVEAVGGARRRTHRSARRSPTPAAIARGTRRGALSVCRGALDRSRMSGRRCDAHHPPRMIGTRSVRPYEGCARIADRPAGWPTRLRIGSSPGALVAFRWVLRCVSTTQSLAFSRPPRIVRSRRLRARLRRQLSRQPEQLQVGAARSIERQAPAATPPARPSAD